MDLAEICHQSFTKVQAFNLSSICPSYYDTITCWPPSNEDVLVHQNCFSELNGIAYNTSYYATRYCHKGGIWATKANYSMCKPLEIQDNLNNTGFSVEEIGFADYSLFIYFSGYSISLVALIIAVGIFSHFNEMKCLRNSIHTNLFITYILSNSCWIITALIQMIFVKRKRDVLLWCISLMFLRYFHLCTFFWMLIEGFFLFVQVICSFSVVANSLRLRHYLVLGWGIPLVILAAWASANQFLSGTKKLEGAEDKYGQANSNKTSIQIIDTYNDFCSFTGNEDFEWIYIAPVIMVLILNTFFLAWIMWIVVTKLRRTSRNPGGMVPAESGGNVNHGSSFHHNWKAAKALLVIIPLLGITYLLTISVPNHKESLFFNVLQHLRAILLSLQGFTVTLPYCFANTEVRNIFQHHWNRYKMKRSLDATRSNRTSVSYVANHYVNNSFLNSKVNSHQIRVSHISSATELDTFPMVRVEDTEYNQVNELDTHMNNKFSVSV